MEGKDQMSQVLLGTEAQPVMPEQLEAIIGMEANGIQAQHEKKLMSNQERSHESVAISLCR